MAISTRPRPSPPGSTRWHAARSSFPSAILLFFAISAAISACGTSSVTLTAPSESKCEVSLRNNLESAPASGGSGSVEISTTRDCTWAASSGTAWITLTSASSGQGSGSISYRVAANSEPAARSGAIEVNSAQVRVAQEAASCRFSVAPTSSSVRSDGDTITVTVRTNAACSWTAASDAPWVEIEGSASGAGDGTVRLIVRPNPGAERTSRATVAGEVISIVQAGAPQAPGPGSPGSPAPGPAPAPAPGPAPAPPAPPPPAPPACTYSISPSGQTVQADGGTGTVQVTAGTGCSWAASADVPWVSLTSGASGSGAGAVGFSVARNAGASRTGTISVAGRTFTVAQAAAACAYTIAPSTHAAGAGGGSLDVQVTTGSACAWTASAVASWLSVTSGALGAGNATVRLAIAANNGGARTGTATIAGQTLTVTQAAAPCSYSVSPAAQSVPVAGGSGEVNVTAGAGCTWSAVSNASWITVTGGSTGTGNGTVAFAAAGNNGAARSGTLTVAGQSVTVTQSAPACEFAIAPTSAAPTSAGGTGTVAVTVTAGAACGWTASSQATWITITSGGAGTGDGTVGYSVAPNDGAARTGTLAIAGRAFTVNQAAAPCTYSIAPAGAVVADTGGPGSLTVSAGPACTWTAASQAPSWLHVTSGGMGTGPGTVGFSADPNPGAERIGTLLVAGQTFTVTQQAAPCTYSIAPTLQAVPDAGGTGTIGVTAGPACAWAASSNAAWITITSGGSGTGNGSVGFAAAANTVPTPRTGTITVAGQVFTVEQAAAP